MPCTSCTVRVSVSKIETFETFDLPDLNLCSYTANKFSNAKSSEERYPDCVWETMQIRNRTQHIHRLCTDALTLIVFGDSVEERSGECVSCDGNRRGVGWGKNITSLSQANSVVIPENKWCISSAFCSANQLA